MTSIKHIKNGEIISENIQIDPNRGDGYIYLGIDLPDGYYFHATYNMKTHISTEFFIFPPISPA